MLVATHDGHKSSWVPMLSSSTEQSAMLPMSGAEFISAVDVAAAGIIDLPSATGAPLPRYVRRDGGVFGPSAAAAAGAPRVDTTGPRGIQGLQGDQGPKGNRGAAGPAGIANTVQGAKGDVGERGLKGLTGLQGLTGIQGPPGVAEKGDRGAEVVVVEEE